MSNVFPEVLPHTVATATKKTRSSKIFDILDAEKVLVIKLVVEELQLVMSKLKS